ncbi:helix-turn-helix domain-containing protein [Streptomyces bobili]|uniref:helix-turn-helix domain-containing protein n=1 Tax=Streptomyces bobili TaxID=67280 RepID=UPI003F4D2BCC
MRHTRPEGPTACRVIRYPSPIKERFVLVWCARNLGLKSVACFMSRGPRPVEVVLSDEERAELLRWADGAVAPRLVERARIVLACADGKPNTRVAAEFKVTADTVRKWRSRFAARRMVRPGRGSSASPTQVGAGAQ